jgi:hypothetical protein
MEKIAKSKQFQQMRALIQRKNTQLATLRGKLLVYEPEDTGEGADVVHSRHNAGDGAGSGITMDSSRGGDNYK